MPRMKHDRWSETTSHNEEDCKVGDADMALDINRGNNDEADKRLICISKQFKNDSP